jgi:hypothetical protein
MAHLGLRAVTQVGFPADILFKKPRKAPLSGIYASLRQAFALQNHFSNGFAVDILLIYENKKPLT